ncbi:MAG TPA: hypothetical protein VJO99_07120 [Burkholderiaceae bacterium]|nr:hypothetical protein [Burkholderiaceae bacterium]
MNTLRPGLPPLPPKMAALPIDKRGFPVPYFVAIINGEPDHRIVEPRAVKACIEQKRCWICGGPLGVYRSFTVGPMCAVNRISGEPPSHLECARYAAQACPFLSRPHAHRREAGKPPETHVNEAMLARNPGVALIWTTRTYRPFKGGGTVLFEMGSPDTMEWYAEGRNATRAEVDESIASGLPTLIGMAEAENDTEGLRIIQRRIAELNDVLDRTFAA